MSGIEGRSIVLFLGAGFAKDAGLPVMSDFGDMSTMDFQDLQKHASAPSDSPHHRYAARLLVDAGEVFYAFRAFCEKSRTLSPERLNDLEIVFSIVEIMREAGVPDIEIGGRSYSVNQVYRDMQIWAWKIYQQYPIENPTRSSITCIETFAKFFRLSKNSGILSKLVVLTTNYDLVYEYQAYAAGAPCVYPLKHVRESNAGNDGHSRFCYVDGSDAGRVPICKLHGSVNYFYDPMGNAEDAPFIFTDLAGDKPIGKSNLRADLPAIFAVDAISNIREKLGAGLTPAIIPPTYAKLTSQPWSRSIWNSAFRALANAEKIVFIGYSMPDSDGFMRALVHSAMAARKSGSPPQVHVIDPCATTRCRYERLFLHGFRPWPKKLGEITDIEFREIFCI